MDSRDRLRREDPARTQPIRNWSTMFRRPDAPEPAPEPTPSHSAGDGQEKGGLGDVLTRGVRLGYDVLNEQMRQGQRVAQKINQRSYGLGSVGGDVREIVERMLGYYTDLAALWFELLSSVATGNLPSARNPFSSGPRPANDPANVPMADEAGLTEAAGEATTSETRSATPSKVSIEVSSARPTQVSLDLAPRSESLPLAIHGLYAGGATPPLRDVTFERDAQGDRVNLRIRVPEEQPADIYTGVVTDSRTRESRGTLTVRITDPATG